MITKSNQPGLPHNVDCMGCHKQPGPIWMNGYSDGNIFLCADCACS